MKRYLPLALILLAALAAIYVAERNKVAIRPGPQAVLSGVADTEWELSRLPDNFDHLSDADEIRIGDQLAQSYASARERKPEPASSRALEAYVQQVGAAVANHARRKLPYRFHYIAEPSFVNAFALPGGHVFVGEGLLRLMQSEDALAAVLGHEVEHIDLGHCAQRIQIEQRLRNLGTLGALAGLPVGVFTADYSKNQELEADDHPGSRLDEVAQLTIQTLQDYFQSHPPAAERKQQIATLIRDQHWPHSPTRPLQLT